MNYKKKTLKNGLRIITVPMPENPAVTVLVMVEAGSKYETKNINGLSHFLEHMCFKGTEKRPKAVDISRELDSLGAQYNAFTSHEYTGYYAKAYSKHLNKILDVLSDMYLNPVFNENEIEKEKGVIIEEINMYEDLPNRRVQSLFTELLYGDQPAGWDIAGPIANIKAIKREDFLRYRAEHYVAKATTVIVSGSFDEKKIFNQVAEYFGKINTGVKMGKQKVSESQKIPAVISKNKDTDQAHLIVGVRAYPVDSKKNTALKVLDAVLGGGMSSRLFQKIRDELGAAYYVWSSVDEFTDHGYLGVGVGSDKGRVEIVLRAILDELKRFTKELVGEEELKKAKDYLVGGMYLGLESSDSLAQFYGGQEVLKHKEETPAQIAKKIRAVTAKEIQNIAKEIFQNKNLNLALVGRSFDEAKLKEVLVF